MAFDELMKLIAYDGCETVEVKETGRVYGRTLRRSSTSGTPCAASRYLPSPCRFRKIGYDLFRISGYAEWLFMA